MALPCPPYAGPIYRWTKEHRGLYNLLSIVIVLLFLVVYALFDSVKILGLFLILLVIIILILLREQVKCNVGYYGWKCAPLKRCFPRNKKTEKLWKFWFVMQIIGLLVILGFIVYIFLF